MMPMSRPRWLDDLPEYLTEAEYRALPEDIARTIEIVHGHVIKCESPIPRHNRIARRLSFALESARSPLGPCLTVETDVDVVLWRVPRFTFRRPDVVVYECIDDPARKPTAQETVLVVEVTSPSYGQGRPAGQEGAVRERPESRSTWLSSLTRNTTSGRSASSTSTPQRLDLPAARGPPLGPRPRAALRLTLPISELVTT